MKKLLTLIFIVLAGLSTVCAQDKYLSLTGGYTAPMGNFAESDLENEESGYAKSGYNFSFEMAFYFNDYIGLGANIRFSNCDFNSDLFNSLLKERFENEMDTINLSSGKYNLQNFLIGPYAKINIGDYISIYGKTFIGVLTTFRPSQTLVYQRYGENLTTKETLGKYRAAFAYNFGAGAFFKINDRIGLNISADYIAGKPKFETYNYLTLETIERKQPVSFIDYNAGIILLF